MTHEEQLIATLQKILDVQTETLQLHRQTLENQQRALAQNQASVSDYARQARLQRIIQILGGVILLAVLFKLFGVWK